jgi:hypothetical protein
MYYALTSKKGKSKKEKRATALSAIYYHYALVIILG